MIDMHSHCLPALDDGARNEDEAIKMLEDAFEKNCDIVVATPHLRVYSDEELSDALNKRDKAFEMLMNEAIKRKSNIPELKKGFEVHLDKDITEFSSFRKLCVEGTSAMLVEMPMHYWDDFAMSRIKSLKDNDIVPVLAHIERYVDFKSNIEKALSLDGVIYQVNADAFFGRHRMRFLKKLLDMGKTVVVGSDMHNLTTRKSRLSEAYEKAVKKNKSYEVMFNTDYSKLEFIK